MHMKKLVYQSPAMEVVGIEPETRLLINSDPETGNASLGGLGDGGDLNDEW